MSVLKIKSVQDLTDESNIEDRVNVLTLILDEISKFDGTIPDEITTKNIFDNTLKKYVHLCIPIKRQYENGNSILNLMLELFEKVEQYEDCNKVQKLKQKLNKQYGINNE